MYFKYKYCKGDLTQYLKAEGFQDFRDTEQFANKDWLNLL